MGEGMASMGNGTRAFLGAGPGRRVSSTCVAALAATIACGDDGSPPLDAGTTTEASTGAAMQTGSTSSLDGSGTTAVATTDTSGSSGAAETEGEPAYPDPGDNPPNTGPGGPAVAFAPEDLYVNCAFLDGGSTDVDHHNLVVMFDGYLMMPWAPEFGGGGISFFDVSDPCQPQILSSTTSQDMRETHATGFASMDDRWYAVTAAKDYGLDLDGGILVWDVTNVAAPMEVAHLNLPGHFYPDAYARVVLSAAWQAPYIYVGGADNGIYIVDASNPADPQLVGQHALEPTLRVGQVNVVGNMLIATAAEGPRTVLLDISVPEAPQPLAGGDFDITDSVGMIRESYFSNIGSGYVYYAIKNGGGGLLVYDIRDPAAPVLAGHFDSGGNGGYVFAKDELAFVGESSFAGIYDLTDPAAITSVAQLDLPGDLDTATPIGNMVVLSVDDEGDPDQASSLAPYAEEVDTVPPRATWTVPADGVSGLPVSSRVGVTFSEMVDPKTVWLGSVRLYSGDVGGSITPVEGIISVQENVVNFTPTTPLSPDTDYTFEIPAGGVADYNGNRVEEALLITFTTLGG
jgi:hypothetical protein